MKYGKRPWEPEEEKQLREMVEAGKTITIMALSSNEQSPPSAVDWVFSRSHSARLRRAPKENPPARADGLNRIANQSQAN